MTTALDLFGGAGGWSVAARNLGVLDLAVELMPEALATREANGLETAFNDVWDGLENPSIVPAYDLEIASPPCQKYSLTGDGEGRRELANVVAGLRAGAYKSPEALRELSAKVGHETALVWTPIAYAFRDRPRLIAWEQVPPVLPVWIACAQVLRGLGYSVWTGIVHAEQFGAPQTRDRAILMARLDGVVQPPKATHSRYYSAEPDVMDRGVLPWVSISEALGYERGAYLSFGTRDNSPIRPVSEPAATLAFGANITSFRWLDGDPSGTNYERVKRSSEYLTIREASTLQGFPEDFIWRGGKFTQSKQIGNAVPPKLAQAVLSSLLSEPIERSEWDHVFAEVAG